MLTNKNPVACRIAVGVSLVLCLLVSGCTPPGPKALLDGKKLLDEGRHGEAVPRLQAAVELLPTNALAWNYLGLAYHLNAQPEQAFKAYQNALSIDHRMAALHFNLGCLYLERNNLSGAIEELKAFTLLQPAATEGWVKLGKAFLQARRLDDSEKAFRGALEVQAAHPEALNGLGLIQIQRRQWQAALDSFVAASAANTNYAPAVLNAAVVQHQYLNNRTAALAQYRRYAALNPADSGVQTILNQLHSDLNPPAATKSSVDIVSQLTPRTNAPTQRLRTNSVPVTNANPVVALAPAVPRTSPAPAPPGITPMTKPAGRTAETNSPILPRPAPLATSSTSRVSVAGASTERPPELRVTRIEDPLVVRPAQDVRPLPNAATNVLNGRLETNRPSSVAAEPPPKKTLLSRLNPFTRSSGDRTGTAPSEMNRPEGLPDTAPPPQVDYAYLSPTRPSPGNRDEAIAPFKRALKAQKAGDRTRAVAEYQSAIRLDPGYFDAYYNLALAALDSGDARLSLWACELALALQPESIDARYNFAMALKLAGYPQDAAVQLEKIVQARPDEIKAHLGLGNLFAQQLRQPRMAREHYLRVLELNAKHPEASTIRYWLAANP